MHKPLKPRHVSTGAVKVKRIAVAVAKAEKEPDPFADKMEATLRAKQATAQERRAVMAEYRRDVAAGRQIGSVASREAVERLQKHRDCVNQDSVAKAGGLSLAADRVADASKWGALMVASTKLKLGKCGSDRSQVGEALLVHLLAAVRVAQEAAGVTGGGSGVPIKSKRSRKPVSSKAVDPVAGMVLN
jgi:hypothetical protein